MIHQGKQLTQLSLTFDDGSTLHIDATRIREIQNRGVDYRNGEMLLVIAVGVPPSAVWREDTDSKGAWSAPDANGLRHRNLEWCWTAENAADRPALPDEVDADE